MNMTDEELDRDWKPNGRRPQSTIARSFSAELMDIFRIENSVADLDEQIDKRKQQINTQTTELEALEARIREMEQRLTGGNGAKATSSPRTSRPPVANAFDNPDGPPPVPQKDQQRSAGRDQQSQKYGGSRPGTARASQQAVPGALPPTPVGSEGESEPHECPRSAPRPPRARLSASIASSGKFSSASSSTTLTRVRESPGDDSGSVQSMSMSGSVTSADYVVVPRPDGDGDKDI